MLVQNYQTKHLDEDSPFRLSSFSRRIGTRISPWAPHRSRQTGGSLKE